MIESRTIRIQDWPGCHPLTKTQPGGIRDLDGYVALTNDRFMKLFDKLISVVADFTK